MVEKLYHFSRQYESIPLDELLPLTFTFLFSIIYLFLRRRHERVTKRLASKEFTCLDSLTKLLNRRTLERDLENEWDRFLRYHENFCIVLFDIDDFSDINDSLGHFEGDRILMEVATLLKNNTRKTDSVGRWGEEEFMILCPVCNIEQVAILAEKLRSNLYRMLKDGVELSASFSIVQSCKTGSLEELIKRAHLGLHKAKGRGKNCVNSFLKGYVKGEVNSPPR